MPTTRLGRNALLLLIIATGLVATGYLGHDGADWFPQRWAHAFYVTKGLVGVVAVVLMLVHMSRAWPSIAGTDQRLRYLALLMATMLIASGSTAQLAEGVPVSGRNVGGLLLGVLIIVAMVVSIRQGRRSP